jgi:hypothetical protein
MGRPSSSDGDGLDEDAHEGLATQTEPVAANIEKAWAAGLKHTQTAADADAQLGHAANPGRLAFDVGHVAALAKPEIFQRQ